MPEWIILATWITMSMWSMFVIGKVVILLFISIEYGPLDKIEFWLWFILMTYWVCYRHFG